MPCVPPEPPTLADIFSSRYAQVSGDMLLNAPHVGQICGSSSNARDISGVAIFVSFLQPHIFSEHSETDHFSRLFSFDISRQ